MRRTLVLSNFTSAVTPNNIRASSDRLIFLNDEYSLTLEDHGKGVRFVVAKNDNGFICRKEKKSTVYKFFQTSAIHLFKGRLQLDKQDDIITISAEGKVIGTADVEEFQTALPGQVPA